MSSLLRVEELSYAYRGGNEPAVAPLSVSWEAGEFCALVGPNGSGKTTLLNLLSGTLPPTTGKILFDGRDLRQWTPDALARQRAVLPQSPRLGFAFTVEEVVALGRSPYGDGPERQMDRERIGRALAEVDLLALRHRPFPQLSRGEKQRAQLARVLAQLPPPGTASSALFLDEPINHLDLEHQHGALTLARRRASEGALVIAVLHDLNLALRYADRALILDHGRLQGDGPPSEVFTPDRLRTVFRVEVERLTGAQGETFLSFRGPPTLPTAR